MRRLAIPALVLLIGCGDDLLGLTVDEATALRRKAECERYTRCGLFTDIGVCAAYFRARPNHSLAAAIEQGKVLFDAGDARRCYAALAEQSCDLAAREVRVPLPSCEGIFTGTLTAGVACALDEECTSGTCDAEVCPRNTCCTGTCTATRPRAPIDAACELDAGCVADAFCGNDLKCHALSSVGGPCDADTHCDYGLGCIGATDQQLGACRLLPKLGESCPYARCAELGAICTNGTCVAVGLPGATCETNTDCSAFGEFDPTTLRCKNLPELGMPCNADCAGDAWCDLSGTPGQCVAPKPNGEACTASDQCASLFCEEGVAFDQCSELPVCI